MPVLPEFRQISPSILGREFVTAEAANLCRGLHGLSALRADLRWLKRSLDQAHWLRFCRLERRQRQKHQDRQWGQQQAEEEPADARSSLVVGDDRADDREDDPDCQEFHPRSPGRLRSSTRVPGGAPLFG